MKKVILASMLVGALFASQADASRARTTVFGTGEAGLVLSKGSFFYNIEDNIFYNPSYVNDFKSFATIEKQTSNAAGTAEGGFFTAFLNYNMGFYFNRGGFQDGASYQNVGAVSSVANMRPIEFFLGSETSGIKWGGSLSYGNRTVANSNNGATISGSPVSAIPFNSQTARDLTLRGGISVMDLEPFFAYKIIGDDTYRKAMSPSFSSNEVKDKNKGWTVGTRYRFGEWTPWIVYDYKKKETDNLAGSNVSSSGGYYWTTDGLARNAATDTRNTAFDHMSNPNNPSQKTLAFGLGRTAQASETVKVHYGIGFVQQVTENTWTADGGGSKLRDGAGTPVSVTTINGVGQDQTRRIIPIQVGVDGEVTTWLVLRGGLQYRLRDNLSTPDGVSGTQADRTAGRLGATIRFSRVDFDWVIANNGGAANAENPDAGTFALDNGLFTQASLTYRW